jgi:hypothetical protein
MANREIAIGVTSANGTGECSKYGNNRESETSQRNAEMLRKIGEWKKEQAEDDESRNWTKPVKSHTRNLSIE